MALTQRYVRADAAGGGDGTTDAASGSNGSWTLSEAITNAAAGMQLNVRAGTYASTTTSRTLATVGTTTAPVYWVGFKTTPGDMNASPESSRVPGTDIPLLTFTTGGMTVSGAYTLLKNIAVSGARTGGTQVTISGSCCQLHRCRIENTGSNSAASALTAGAGTQISESQLKATTTATRVLLAGSTGVGLYGLSIEGGISGFELSAGVVDAAVIDCQFANLTYGISSASTGFVVVNGCSFYNQSTDGIRWTALPSTRMHVVRNTVTQCGTYGLDNGTGTATSNIGRFSNLNFGGTQAENGFGDSAANGSLEDVDDPFVSAPTDMTPASGSLGLQSASPGLFEGQSYRSYASRGAVQPQGSGGSPTYTSAANVRSGVDRGDGTLGTLIVPAAGDVQSGVSFDNGTPGTLVLPTAAQVLNAVGFGADGTEFTGTIVLPSVDDVRVAVAFGPSSGSTGTVTLPDVANVVDGITYGADGTEFTGTLSDTPATLAQIQAALDAGVHIKVGTGVGQLDIAGGVAKANVVQTNGVVAQPVESVGIKEGGLNAGSATPEFIAAVQDGLSTYNGSDTAGTATLVGRLTSDRANNLDYLDASVDSRLPTSSYTAPITPPTAAAIRAEIDTSSTKLAQIAGAFGGSGSVFTSQSLVNAPTGSGADPGDIAEAVWDAIAVNTTSHRQLVVAVAAILLGKLTDNSDHTTSSFTDINDPNGSPRVTSVNGATTRTVTVN